MVHQTHNIYSSKHEINAYILKLNYAMSHIRFRILKKEQIVLKSIPGNAKQDKGTCVIHGGKSDIHCLYDILVTKYKLRDSTKVVL